MNVEILLHAGGNAVIYFLGNYFVNFVFLVCLFSLRILLRHLKEELQKSGEKLEITMFRW